MYKSENVRDKRKLHPVQAVIAALCVALLVTAAAVVGFIVKSMKTPPEVSGFVPAIANVDADGDDGGTAELVRRENFYNFLVVGTDRIGLNTDTIILVSLDCQNGSAAALQIPRDTYIRYDGTGRKINSILPKLYAEYQSDGKSDPQGRAARGFADILEESLGVPIDYYLLVDLGCLREIVDIIGGVTLNVPADMYYVDTKQELYIDLKAGEQTLNGDQAEQFIRYRSGYIQADIGRIDAQKIFMAALLDKVKNELSLSQLCDAAASVFKNVTTSLSLSDAVYFASVVYNSVDMSDVVMKTVQGEAYNNGVFYVIYKEAAYETVNRYFNAYNLDIPYNSFDISSVFTNSENREIDSIYKSDAPSSDGRTAEEIDKDGINIPRLKQK